MTAIPGTGGGVVTPPVAHLTLPDRRRLAFRAYGPDDGAPVLFVPGAASGSAMRFGTALLDGCGVRLISVDRPGLGGSDPDPGKTLASVGADLRRLADDLGGPLPVVANSQGAPFALAAALAGAASRLVLVSPSDEVAHPPVTAGLPEPVRALVAAVAADPEGAAARFAAFSAPAFFDFVLSDHPASDAPVYGDPGFRALLRAALDEGFGAGPAGYARDTVLAMRPWGLPLDALAVPVTVLFGADDVVHSPDLGATLAARIPAAERVVVPGVGGSLLWARPELVLAAAVRPAP
jgi:pimeloyl-ACP methyl ester carboxylesterase